MSDLPHGGCRKEENYVNVRNFLTRVFYRDVSSSNSVEIVGPI